MAVCVQTMPNWHYSKLSYSCFSFLSLSNYLELVTGADPGFVLLGGALVSCSTSIPINHKGFFFLAEYQLY